MLTYTLKKTPGVPLYEALYRAIRQDILDGKLVRGEKLPSKRALSQHLEISKITVENAYNQLLAEGYISSREKIGYFVEQVERAAPGAAASLPAPAESAELADLTGGGATRFPFSVWMKLQRSVMLDYGENLLRPMPNRGIGELRQAIADHLAAFRGMRVDPECILIGAGGDFLYNLLVQLLGRELTYAVEEPGYGKIRSIYGCAGVRCISAGMDSQGVVPEYLGDADVLHISPSHHFPTGIITTLQRRMELLKWAQSRDGYIIEDDYDSEFRFNAHPMPAMQSLDRSGRVIYMNSFSRTLSPAIRISYMVLPEHLMAHFRTQLGFYSCTVPSFEQYTLARFLREGYFEKHINRMRKFYRARRNRVIDLLKNSDLFGNSTILEENAGLHFLLQVDTDLTDAQLEQRIAQAGIRVEALSRYYHENLRDTHTLVINYSGVDEELLARLLYNRYSS